MYDDQRVSADRPWASVVGYSRAIRRGALIEISGTSATTADGQVIAPNDPYRQTAYVLEQVVGALAELGASASDVIRTRVFLTDIVDWEAVGRAHGEVLSGIDPTCSFVEIGALMLPELVVEVEATAIVGEVA